MSAEQRLQKKVRKLVRLLEGKDGHIKNLEYRLKKQQHINGRLRDENSRLKEMVLK